MAYYRKVSLDEPAAIYKLFQHDTPILPHFHSQQYYCLPKIQISPLVLVSPISMSMLIQLCLDSDLLVMNSFPAESHAKPDGLKHPEEKLGPLPWQLSTLGL